MDDQIITIYCLVGDVLNAMNHYEDSQVKMKDSEIMTTTHEIIDNENMFNSKDNNTCVKSNF